jgi:hypothetical protein
MVNSITKFKSTVVNTFQGFLAEIKSAEVYIKNNPEIEFTIFRGQPVDENLFPRIGRSNYNIIDRNVVEKKIFDEFKRLYVPYAKISNFNDWDILALAQHHFLPTRLLDWTENPLIALWFAFNEFKMKSFNPVVWCFGFAKFHILEPNDSEFFNHKSTIVFKPRHITKRLVNQNGWFTSHWYGSESKKYSALNNLEPHWPYIYRITFSDYSQEFSKDTLRQLNTFGINSYSIFPDLEGLCKYLEWKTYFR